jgi:hypothetical protein
MTDHLYDAHKPEHKQDNTLKCRKINSILRGGGSIVCSKVRDFESETDALSFEKQLIQQYGRLIDGTGTLCNIQEGGTQPPLQPNKRVYAFNSTGSCIQTYNNTFEAAEQLNVTVSVVQNCCAGRSKTCKGMMLSYTSSVNANDLARRFTHANIKADTIHQYLGDQLMATYRSLTEAATHTGTTHRQISRAIRTQQRHKGFYWRR